MFRFGMAAFTPYWAHALGQSERAKKCSSHIIIEKPASWAARATRQLALDDVDFANPDFVRGPLRDLIEDMAKATTERQTKTKSDRFDKRGCPT